MKIYEVGGAVRDELLGLPVSDRDYVVVGATPEEMVKLGYKPVGKDFPVFLHPESHEEYALARTERKTAHGYHGFEFYATADVTLEQDLARRDLTINAMAKDKQGRLIDPFGGEADLRAGVLRHVSPAFAEDPVRILRVARFAARFDFTIAPETFALLRRMVEQREADALVPERVWQELARGFMERRPSRMLRMLHACGALERIVPEIDSMFGHDTRETVLQTLDASAEAGAALEVRVAALCRSLDPIAVEQLANRLKMPVACRDLAVLAARHAYAIADARELDAAELLELLNACDAWRRPERFDDLVTAATINEPGAQQAREALLRARQAGAAVNGAQIAQGESHPRAIGSKVAAARLDAIRRALTEDRGSGNWN